MGEMIQFKRPDGKTCPGYVAHPKVGSSAQPVDARNAGVGIVDRGRQRADRNLDDLSDAELAILRERAVTTDVNSTINRCLKLADFFRWDDCCERLTTQHELAWAELQHDQCVRCVRSRDQRAVIDMLQVSALRAR